MTDTEFYSSVSPKGQITIPLEIRRQLGIKPRDRVAFRLDNGRVTIAPAENEFLAAYRSIPPLKRSLTDDEVTRTAADEAAEKAAREGLDRRDDR